MHKILIFFPEFTEVISINSHFLNRNILSVEIFVSENTWQCLSYLNHWLKSNRMISRKTNPCFSLTIISQLLFNCFLIIQMKQNLWRLYMSPTRNSVILSLSLKDELRDTENTRLKYRKCILCSLILLEITALWHDLDLVVERIQVQLYRPLSHTKVGLMADSVDGLWAELLRLHSALRHRVHSESSN